MKIKRVGVDIGKNVFHLCAVNQAGRVMWRKEAKRHRWLSVLEQAVEPGIEVGMEACGGAHHWARELNRRGFNALLIAPQYVKPFVKSHKTDQVDAEAITEAMSRPQMRFVSIKNVSQQDMQATHRIRDELIKRRTALGNQIRGLAAEYGLVAPAHRAQLRRALRVWIDDPDSGLTALMRELLDELHADLVHVDERVKTLDRRLGALAKRDPVAQRLQQLRGVGPICATIMASALGDGSSFRNGRDFAVSLGLTPRQHSTGGKATLRGITKHGDGYIRKQLVHGARSAIRTSSDRQDALSQWIHRLAARKHANVVTIALAAKTARMAWALVKHQSDYDPRLAAAHPGVQISTA